MTSMSAPKDWIYCPKKSYLIGGKFVAFKTPLDHKFEKKLKKVDIFTPDDVFDWITKSKLNLGLWVDLTKTTRYFNGDVVKKRGCQYEKIWCEGHGSVPDWKQVKTFTDIIDKFIAQNPDKIIGVHCTHGYNRTGYLIVTYLVNRMNFQIDDALKAFSNGRPPGIYREPYVKELIHRYHGDLSKHFIVTPFWVKREKDNQVEIPLRLGAAEVARVIVPKEQLAGLSEEAIPGKVVCISGTNGLAAAEAIPNNHHLGQSFVQDHETYRCPQTYEEERRKQASQRRWRDFDRRRREKRNRTRDEDRDYYQKRQITESHQRDSYHNYCSTYHRPRSSPEKRHRSRDNDRDNENDYKRRKFGSRQKDSYENPHSTSHRPSSYHPNSRRS